MRALSPLPFALACLIAIAVSACGVKFRETFEGTELFKGMSVCDQSGAVCASGSTREFPAGSELTIDLVITQGYPVPVRVACYYEDGDRLTEDQKKLAFQERATLAAETVLPAAPGRRPDEKTPEQHLTFKFRIAEPGDYFLACMTPAAADNGLGVGLKIRNQ